MEIIYEKALEAIRNGASFSVDFKKRKLSVNGKVVALDSATSSFAEKLSLDEWLDKVEGLYDSYKYSRPTQTSMGKHKTYFKGLSVNGLVKECGHSALSNPISRDEAQAALEIFILLTLVDGIFKPEELFAKDWFFQGTDKSLIIRKDWF